MSSQGGFFSGGLLGAGSPVVDAQNVANRTATQHATMQSTILGAMANGALPPVQRQHGHAQLKPGESSMEFYFIAPVGMQSPGSTARRMLPAYDVASAAVALGREVNGDITLPGEIYATRGEALAAVAVRVRNALRKHVEQLCIEMTEASTGNGLLEDPELDLADALRKYLAAVQP